MKKFVLLTLSLTLLLGLFVSCDSNPPIEPDKGYHDVEIYELGTHDIGYANETRYFIHDIDANEYHYIYSRVNRYDPSRTISDAYVDVNGIKTQDGNLLDTSFRVLSDLVPVEVCFTSGTYFYRSDSDGSYAVSHVPPEYNAGYTRVTGYPVQITSTYDFVFIDGTVYSVLTSGGAYTIEELTAPATGRLYNDGYIVFPSPDPIAPETHYDFKLVYNSNVFYFNEDDSPV